MRNALPISVPPRNGEGGGHNATLSTLFALPSLYAILQGRGRAASPSRNPHDLPISVAPRIGEPVNWTAALTPDLMPASAIITSTIPVALGIGEGGRQNATFSTLFALPSLYAILQGRTRSTGIYDHA